RHLRKIWKVHVFYCLLRFHAENDTDTHAHEIETIAEIRRELEQVRKDKENAENEKLALNASNERLKKAAAEQGAGT
ncbi:hypothetical protein BT96DRAFT_882875, partial [Gymnopus androsaceus JB14]